MRYSPSVPKVQCIETLAPEMFFTQGSNINSSGESCGKLKASGFSAKCLAAKPRQAESREILAADSD
jgi:hypothetical protein